MLDFQNYPELHQAVIKGDLVEIHRLVTTHPWALFQVTRDYESVLYLAFHFRRASTYTYLLIQSVHHAEILDLYHQLIGCHRRLARETYQSRIHKIKSDIKDLTSKLLDFNFFDMDTVMLQSPFHGTCGLMLFGAAVRENCFKFALQLLKCHRYLCRYTLFGFDTAMVSVIKNWKSHNGSGNICDSELAAWFASDRHLPSLGQAIRLAVDIASGGQAIRYERTPDVELLKDMEQDPDGEACKTAYEAHRTILTAICEELRSDDECHQRIYMEAAMVAVQHDFRHPLEVIIKCFPGAIWLKVDNYLLIEWCIKLRCLESFNILVKEMTSNEIFVLKDPTKLLHLAVTLPPTENICPVLFLQKEMYWYKKVERLVLPKHREAKNEQGDTPRMLFHKAHEHVRKDAEKWIKDVAKAYGVVSGLIVCRMYSSSITIPGGYKDDGSAIFSSDTRAAKAEILRNFLWFNEVVFLTSVLSLFLFLSLVTSRFRSSDFSWKLPYTLMVGVTMLSCAVVFMIFSFVNLELLSSDTSTDTLIMKILSLIPVILFVRLHCLVLWDIIKTSIGCS